MKTFILLATICVLGIASAKPHYPHTGIEKDLAEFINLLPQEKVFDLVAKYLNGKDFQETSLYLKSKEFAEIWVQLSTNTEVKEFTYYLNDAGLPILQYLNYFALALDLPPFVEHPHLFKRSIVPVHTGGWNGYLEAFAALLPKEEIKALFDEKMETSKEFAELYHKISSAEFQRIAESVKDSQELNILFGKMQAHGFDIYHYVDTVARMFGWIQ